jgi:aspartyl protease family protein
MGMQDRDWWQEAQRDRERKSERFARENRSRSSLTRTLRLGTVWIILFWTVVMSALYLGAKRYLAPKPITISMAGELRIPRGRDGHYVAPGTVNGVPVNFLIDTGASFVTVSEAFARSAGLPQGVPTVFHTANGPLSGRIVSDVEVSLGPVAVSGIRIGIGFVGANTGDALLGQNFLSKFHVAMANNELILSRP